MASGNINSVGSEDSIVVGLSGSRVVVKEGHPGLSSRRASKLKSQFTGV